MIRYWTWLVLTSSLSVVAQQPVPTAPQTNESMLVGVSRDDSMFKGGISSSRWTGAGTVVLEPIAQITASGQWIHLPCESEKTKDCMKFAHEYLSKMHTYTVVSADGNGASIQAAPVSLSDCFGYDGTGTYTGGKIAASAISASSTEIFAQSVPPKVLDKSAAEPVLKALASLIPQKLDSESHLRLSSLQLEGLNFIIVQRAFADYAGVSDKERLGLIFAIGQLDHGAFRLLHWKQNTEDEDERVLGTFQLKSGKQYLVTVVSDPESQSFRAYGIIGGKLTLIWSGGGASC